jgi:hypothetical protein
MYTVKSVMSQLTDPKVVLQNVSDTLRRIDPNFLQEEQQYLRAVDALKEAVGDSVSPTASEYIAAREQEICAELIYVAWLGFQQNLECFQNPINTMFLKMDYEDFHRERRMHTLPEVQKALKTINAFYEVLRTLPEEKRNLTDGITDYMSYLETTGYKLAHYFGFIFADQFLYHVIPGFTKDSITTLQYTRDLRKYLQLDLCAL